MANVTYRIEDIHSDVRQVKALLATALARVESGDAENTGLFDTETYLTEIVRFALADLVQAERRFAPVYDHLGNRVDQVAAVTAVR
jgi:hypothetical protein